MQITYKKSDSLINFGDMVAGAIFEFQGNFYCKIRNDEALNLSLEQELVRLKPMRLFI